MVIIVVIINIFLKPESMTLRWALTTGCKIPVEEAVIEMQFQNQKYQKDQKYDCNTPRKWSHSVFGCVVSEMWGRISFQWHFSLRLLGFICIKIHCYMVSVNNVANFLVIIFVL